MSKRQSTALIGLLAALVLAVAYSIIFQTPVPVQLDFPNEDTVIVNPVWPTPAAPVPLPYDTTNLDSLTLSGNLSAADVAASDDLTVADDATITDLLTAADVTTTDDLTVGDDAALGDNLNIAAGGGIFHDSATGEGSVFEAEIATVFGTTTTAAIVIPANANVVDYSFIVTTAYNDSGTEVMNCGPTTDQDKFVDDLNLAAGRNFAHDATDMQSDEITSLGDVGASNLSVVCVFTGQNGDASAGAGRFIVWWKLD